MAKKPKLTKNNPKKPAPVRPPSRGGSPIATTIGAGSLSTNAPGAPAPVQLPPAGSPQQSVPPGFQGVFETLTPAQADSASNAAQAEHARNIAALNQGLRSGSSHPRL